MEKVNLLAKEASKKRKTSENADLQEAMESSSFPVKRFNFNVTSMDALSTEVVEMCKKDEEKMAKEDIKEFRRQEAKNMLEEQLYKHRSTFSL